MALIKHAKSDRLLKEAIVLDMGDLGRQAERMLNEAREAAVVVVEQGRAEARRLTDGAAADGHAQGFEQGLAEGRESGRREGREQALQEHRQRLQELSQQWAAALVRWEAQRDAMHQQAREDIITFALALARRVVHRLVHSDPTIIRDQLAEALNLLGRATATEVIVNPRDRQVVEEVLPEVIAGLAGCRHASIREDASVGPGGCVVVTAGGRIDATIETQLDRIAEALAPAASPSPVPDQPMRPPSDNEAALP